MSLKTFHLIFISCSGLLSVLLAFWGLRLYMAEGNSRGLGLGLLGLAMAAVLFFYERWFSGAKGPLAKHD